MEFAGLARRFARYGAVGVLTNLSGYGLFLALLFAGLSPVKSTVLVYLLMVLASYLANRRWTFRSGNSHVRDMPRYLVAYGVGLLVAMGTMYILAQLMHPALAQIVVIGLAAIVIYATLEFLRFGRLDTDNAD